jgi:hypothetical protein
MPSVVQGLLALFLITFWAGVEVFQFRAPMHAAPAIVAVLVLPLAWWRRSPMLLFFGLAVLFAVTAFAAGWVDAKALVPLLFTMAAAAVVAAAAAPQTAFPAAEGPLRGVGLVVALGCGYALSFPSFARTMARIDFHEPAAVIYVGAACVALVAAAIVVGMQFARRGGSALDRFGRVQLMLLAAALAIVLAVTFGRFKIDGWLLALPFNVFVLGLAAVLILEGSTILQPWRVAAGCVVFAIVTMSRYADLFTSLLARSAVFVALGAGLFVVGNFYARQRRMAQTDAR